MSRPISWITLSLTLAPLLLLFATTTGKSPPLSARLRAFSLSLLIPGVSLVAYSVTSAYMSGRFGWPLFLCLAPVLGWRIGGPGNRSVGTTQSHIPG